MSLGSSVNILHWFVVVVVWQTGPWCTFYISGTFTTNTCVLADKQPNLCIKSCTDQWVHVISKKFQAGCDYTDPSYTLQSNTSQSLTVTCAGRQQTSDLCSGCSENVTPPDTYSGNDTTVTLNGECIDDSAISNLCADLPDTTTNQLYLASPSLFLASGSSRTRCRCDIQVQHPAQVEILFADISTSMFTITCGQLIVSDGNFTTNVTNTVMSLPVGSSDCVINVDQRGANRTDGLPTHRVWTKFTGSSITFRCNTNSSASTPSFTSSSSSSSSSETDTTTTMPASTTTTVVNSSTVPPTSSSVSTFASHTTSNETTTTNDTNTEGNMTTSLTTFDAATGAQVDQTVPYPYIIAGVAGGVVLVIIILVIVIVVRRSGSIYESFRNHSPGGQRDDDEHLYSRLAPGATTSVQHTAGAAGQHQGAAAGQHQGAAAGQDQRPHGNEQSGVQGSNTTNVATAPSLGYENVAMTQLMEAERVSHVTKP